MTEDQRHDILGAKENNLAGIGSCLLYTSDAADD